MRWLAIALPLVLLALASPASAADAHGGTSGVSVGISPGEVVATPEMWFYEQALRQWQDPKVALRLKAELKANQRQERIAARKWFGFSNARPTVSADPYYGDYAPHWSSNNGHYPFRWNGVGSPLVVLPECRSTY